MEPINPEELWFNEPDSDTLCRGGGNGPNHPSQLYAILKYVVPLYEETKVPVEFLDYGSGSATTLEAIINNCKGCPDPTHWIRYMGVDIIPKNTAWCQSVFPGHRFAVNPSIHRIDQPDKSWDVVYSRHVVDHMRLFEEAMDEHKRVAKKLVIVILWVGFSNQDEHEIKNIDYRPSGGKLYPDEYTNTYSLKKVRAYLQRDPKWELVELNENVGNNQVIVLRRK